MDDALERAWPLFGIRLAVGDVELRPVRETDLVTVAGALPDDAELDPASVMFDGLADDLNRRRLVLQSYWKQLGDWSPATWTLLFGVRHRGRLDGQGGALVGIQALEGSRFPELRTVDSFSWLAPDARGRGIGTAMRSAVLSLAFDRLGAEFAVSSARDDNAASIAVSSKLGYTDNGISRNPSPSGPCTLRHMMLRRETWEASGTGASVTTSGVRACAPWFGVTITDVADTT